MLFSVHPLVWGHCPVSSVDRDGVQTGCVTYACSNTVDDRDSLSRFGICIRLFPYAAIVPAAAACIVAIPPPELPTKSTDSESTSGNVSAQSRIFIKSHTRSPT